MYTAHKYMDKSKLEKLYDKVTPKKLVEVFDKANHFKKQATQLEKDADTVIENIIASVERRLHKLDVTKEHLGIEQIFEMSKQWSIMAASIVRVKHSVKLDSFHSRLNLYINMKYGVKEYKRFTKYSPFHLTMFQFVSETKPFRYQRKQLMIMRHSWDEGALDFEVLQQISQLDQDKVNEFIEITKEIVCMTDSWRNFYKIKDCPESKAYKEMKKVTSFYMIDEDREKFRINLSNLDKLIAFKTKLFTDTIKQAARWEPMIEKWKEANKNFLVLNELRKSELKI